MLTEAEAKAVDRWRSQEYSSLETEQLDLYLLADAVDRLYPPGWNDPVTPERLVGLGGELAQMSEVITFESCAEFWFSACDVRQCHVYDKYRTTWVRIPCYMIPRNMKEARELLERCGAIKEAT